MPQIIMNPRWSPRASHYYTKAVPSDHTSSTVEADPSMMASSPALLKKLVVRKSSEGVLPLERCNSEKEANLLTDHGERDGVPLQVSISQSLP